jgi:hypothetical protein
MCYTTLSHWEIHPTREIGDNMARPNKIGDKTKSYNLTVSVADYNELDKFATRESDRYAIQVSVADLIRNAIKLYLEDLRIANDE